MAVVSVKPKPGSRTARSTSSGDARQEKQYHVFTDDAHTDEWEVLAAAVQQTGFVGGAQHPNDPFSRVVEATANEERDKSGRVWEVRFVFERVQPDQGGDNPLDDPPELFWDGVKFERIVTRDVFGELIRNTAGDPFAGVTRDDTRPVLRVIRNELLFDPSLAMLVADTINGDVFLGFPPGTVKAGAPVSQRLFHPLIGFYARTQYLFEFRAEGWNAVLLNAGMRELNPFLGGALAPIYSQGVPVSEPVLLDAAGEQSPGGPPIFLQWQVYDELPFSAIFGF